MKISRNIPAIISVLFISDIIFGLIYLLLYKFGDPLPNHTLVKLFDLNGEANLPAWYSSMQLFGISILFEVFAYYNFNKHDLHSWSLVLLAVLFFILSADEVAQIHERIGKIIDIVFPKFARNENFFKNTGIWMFVVGIPFIVVLIFLLKSSWTYFRNYKGISIRLIIGMIIWLFGALVAESFSNLWEQGTKSFVVEVYFEESCEMIGETFIFWASYILITKNKFMKLKNK
jgi:hypothetical protein